MTDELTKTFFDTFGIEAKYESHSCDGWGRTVEVKYFTDKKEADKFGMVLSELEYPQITDRILLELICIRCKELISIIKVKGDNREELKNYILKLCIEDYTFYSKISVKTYNELANNFKHQVRTLFGE